jgi:thiosulfate dehydrogenase
MDWPVATAYATIFAATLSYIDRVSDALQPAPSSFGIGRVVQQQSVPKQSTLAQDPGMSASTALPPVTTAKADGWIVSNIDALPNDEWGKAVRFGRELTVATYAHLGPDVANPAKRFAGSNMSCQSCHLEAGAKEFGLPFVGVFADFPEYRSREGEVGTLEDRINGCMTRSLNGRALPIDSYEMKAFVAYIKFLSTGRPVGAKTLGRGPGEMAELARPADPVAGAKVFAQTCSACHGDNGQGKRVGVAGDAKGYEFPPLWGADSFNNGAGMGRLISAANFIHSNMPNGTTYDQPALSVEEAWDVAAYVESMRRPQKAGLDKDFPIRTEKPADAGYGPYVDGFGEDQHKFGPFQPIRDRLKALKKASTAAEGTNPSVR